MATRADRGVSPIIGALLLAFFLVTGLSLYQVQVVPQQNEQVEFQHYLDVIGDMQNLRNAILSVAETNALEAVSVKLGVRYPSRTLTVNPPPARGTLRTERVGTGIVEVSGVNMTALCGLQRPVRTKSIVYEPGYNYFDEAEPIRYGSTVLYREGEGGVVFESSQAIIQGKTINLPPIIGNLSASSARQETFDFEGAPTGTIEVAKSLRVTIPTRLSADTWENELLAGQSNVQSVDQNGSNAVDINLKADNYKVKCTAVGAGETPEANPALAGEDREINPAAPGGVRLQDEIRGSGGSKNVVTLDLNNTGAIDLEIEQARINFYYNSNDENKDPENADLREGGTVRGNLGFREDFVRLSPQVTLAGNGTITPVELVFYADSQQSQDASLSQSDWFVITFIYSNDETATYFVPVPK